MTLELRMLRARLCVCVCVCVCVCARKSGYHWSFSMLYVA